MVAETTSYIASKATSAPILDMAYNGTKMIAVGDRGHLLAFIDDQWQQLSTPSQALLTAVTFKGKNGWAVGHDATILTTTDGGYTWQLKQQFPDLDKPLLDVIALSVNNIIAVGAYGLTYRSSDGGNSWTSLYFNELLHPDDQLYLDELKAEDEALYLDERSAMLPHFNRIVPLRSGKLVMVGEMGLIALSDDGGASWQNQEPFYDGSLFDLLETKSGAWVAIGLRGNIFRSTDQGQSWQSVRTKVSSTINSATQLRDGTIVMVANNGYLLTSTDDGQTYQTKIEAKGEDLVAVAQQKDGRVIVAGSAGVRWLGL
ncbi:YCF48-related protein [uncultured Ferrimonas sp.]|uniref:WD40/YVTN/BNR-like repeat-containing protein n=1 Tax=uncultured Ferrimonas sp. TaxID=432640 RepID=UPI00260A3519|nr:YCF48-related protein [uncultured Ferrimonas sp.]